MAVPSGSTCVGFDWAAALAVLLYASIVFIAKRELYLGAIFRLANAVLLGIYVGEYIYIAYLLPYVNQQLVAVFVAIITVIVVLLLLYWLDNSALILVLIVVLSSYGLVWWVMSLIAVFVGVAAAFIIWRNELDYLTMCFFDSAVLSIVIMISLVGIFTNFWPSNAPDTCSTDHVNIVLICEIACASVLTDGNIHLTAWEWGIIVVVLTPLRFGWVYWKEVCGREQKVKAEYEKQFPPRRSSWCTCCCKPETQQDCCFCLMACCAATPTSAKFTPVTEQQRQQRTASTRHQPLEGQEVDSDLELEAALAESEQEEQQRRAAKLG